MTVTVVRTEDPDEEAPPAPVVPLRVEAPPDLRYTPPPPVVEEPAPVAPQGPPPGVDRLAATTHAVGILTALAAVLSIRLALTLAVLGSVGLTLFAEVQPERGQTLAVVAAALFTLFGLIPLVVLAYRKG